MNPQQPQQPQDPNNPNPQVQPPAQPYGSQPGTPGNEVPPASPFPAPTGQPPVQGYSQQQVPQAQPNPTQQPTSPGPVYGTPAHAQPGNPTANPYQPGAAPSSDSKAALIGGYVLAVILPVIGFFVGLLRIFNGKKRGDRSQIKSGILTTVISLIVGISISAYFFTQSTGIGSLVAKSLTVNGNQVEISVPDKMKEITNKSDTITFGIEGDEKDTYSSQVGINVQKDSFDAESLILAKEALENPTGETGSYLIPIVKNTFETQISKNLCSKANLDDPKKAEVKNAEFAYRFDFTCEIKDDSSQKIKGYILAAAGKADEFTVVVAANEKVWSANEKKFQQIGESVSITEK